MSTNHVRQFSARGGAVPKQTRAMFIGKVHGEWCWASQSLDSHTCMLYHGPRIEQWPLTTFKATNVEDVFWSFQTWHGIFKPAKFLLRFLKPASMCTRWLFQTPPCPKHLMHTRVWKPPMYNLPNSRPSACGPRCFETLPPSRPRNRSPSEPWVLMVSMQRKVGSPGCQASRSWASTPAQCSISARW